MYGPYYASLAEEAGGKRVGESGFALAVTFAVAVQLAVSGLVNLLIGLEGATLTSNTILTTNASSTTNSSLPSRCSSPFRGCGIYCIWFYCSNYLYVYVYICM